MPTSLKIQLDSEHKFVPVLKRLLNELLKLTPPLPEDNVYDDRTQRAVVRFKVQVQLLPHDRTVGIPTWLNIGRALGKQRLVEEAKATDDRELRALLMGMTVLAVDKYYTHEMERCDKKLAAIFGGTKAIIAAEGFEPEGLAFVQSYYRGDVVDRGKMFVGHLSYTAMHLYGSSDGTRFGVDGSLDTDIYIPAGFERLNQARRQTPTATSARVNFYYKKLGSSKTDVTLVVDHVNGFGLRQQGDRWHSGRTGGRGGGGSTNYRHAHLELYKGDVGHAFVMVDGRLDTAATESRREKLRIPFADVFCK